eukprot:TRINITY_DN37_c0_g1_i1.p1 TRINITY_DN37_c0_g1~~TRINITY_DN37_c0_g1_i1.p1  ORF type:complete len:496 (+),score=126.46 TRINITY_DN37_c0_g1_i1:51-1490(+)
MARFLALLVLACLALTPRGAEDPDVVVLTKDNFDSILESNPVVMVEFYAPWCGHCKQLAPEYSRAATQLKGSGIILGKVDATQEQELAEKHGVRGYPTIKVFQNGDPTEYEGGRTAGDIVAYLKKQSGPAVTTIASVDALDSFVPTEGEPVVVAYVAEGTPEHEFYFKYASSHRNDNQFGAVTDAAVAAELGASIPSIVVYKPFDERKASSTDFTEDSVRKFIQANILPLFGEINPGNYRLYVSRGLPIGWLFVDPSDDAATESAKRAIAEVAPEGKGVLSLVHLNGVQYKQMVTKMALSGNVFPAFAIETTDGTHYAFPEDSTITAENFRAWLEQYKSGTLRASIKSEPIPANAHDTDNVRILVGNNFEEVVLQSNKDVLIEFYAPWCGHCKHLAPIYGELATELKDVDSIVIAKMDATANDAPVPGFQVSGFPTIKFVSSSHRITEYDGPRTKEGFLEFLKKNADTPFNIPASNDEL